MEQDKKTTQSNKSDGFYTVSKYVTIMIAVGLIFLAYKGEVQYQKKATKIEQLYFECFQQPEKIGNNILFISLSLPGHFPENKKEYASIISYMEVFYPKYDIFQIDYDGEKTTGMWFRK